MEKNIRILKDGKFVEERKVKIGSSLLDLAKKYEDGDYKIMVAGTWIKSADLSGKIRDSWDYIDFQTAKQVGGYRALERAITFVFLRAAYEILGKESEITVENSLDKGVFCKVKPHIGWLSEETVAEIKDRMEEIIRNNEPFEKYHASPDEAALKIHPIYVKNKAKKWNKKEINMYRLGWMTDYFLDSLPPSTGYITVFDLKYIDDGILIRMPSTKNPAELPPFVHDRMMSETYRETEDWLGIIGVPTVGHLNKAIENGNFRKVIQVSEALHEKKISEIANAITTMRKRIILIAGPSSSGKTSFAQRLAVQLNVNGIKACTISTDDYFIDREFVAKDEEGKYLFEDLEAVDVELFNKHMNSLLAGEEVDIPVYDFISGKKIFGKRMKRLAPDETIIIEGIHGLNDALTPGIRSKDKFKIYISPLTGLAINEHTRIYSSDARLFRRLVRDARTRNKSAEDTISSWSVVRAGEEKNIFPFQEDADVMFNSALAYELAALKKYAKPVLDSVPKDAEKYYEAVRLSKLLDFFCDIPDESAILNNSLLREFIGGTCLFED